MDRRLFDDESRTDEADFSAGGDVVLSTSDQTALSLLEELRSLYACVNVGAAPSPDCLAKAHELVRIARLTLGVNEPAAALTDRRSPGLRSGGLADWQLKAVRALVLSNLEDRPSVVQLAATARLSVSHFSRTFRETCGMSPMDYIMRTRIEMARALLLDEDLSLREIALKCGFADQSHFCRVFRTVTGRPPKQWRLDHTLGAGSRRRGAP